MSIPLPKKLFVQRIKSLDLARGFTVFMITPIHTVMLYSSLSVRETLMGKLMAFIAEGPGAQLFMLLMGVYLGMSSRKNFGAICKRTFWLVLAGYGLNIFKFVIPHFFGWLPDNLLSDLDIGSGMQGYVQLFSIGDILQFAAISTVVLFLVQVLPYAQIASLGLASLVGLLSPFVWDLHSHNGTLNYLLQLSGGQPPQIFFPLFPWLVYPLMGFVLGIYLKKAEQRQHAFWICRDTGWILILVGNLVKYFSPSIPMTSFYRTEYYDTMIHLGIVLVTLSVWEWIGENVKENHFFEVLWYTSRNITAIYLIQWGIICWLLPVFGYHRLGFAGSLLAILVTTFTTISISFFFKRKTTQESPTKE